MENHLLACPVCTLYLREGMSMQSHLNTHPKDQVIDALVRMCSTERTTALQPEPQSSAIFNPFHVVSEEHIILGRQQVTNIIHTPVLPYIYPQQPPAMVSDYMGQTNDTARGNEALLNLGQNASSNGSALLTTLVNVQDEGAVDITDMMSSKMSVMNNDNSKCYIEVQNAAVTVTQRSEIPGKPDITTQVRAAENADQYITSDCDYQDEDARHSNDLDDPGYGIDDCNTKLTTDERSCLSNIRSAGSSLPRVELAGNNSLHASNTSVWMRDNIIAAPNEENAFREFETLTHAAPTPVNNPWESSLPNDKKPDIKKNYQCLYCEEIFSCPKERRVHVASNHCNGTKTKRSEALCNKCDMKFPTVKELKAHTRLKHKKTSRQCGVCLEEFVSLQKYSEHISKVHPLECRTCGKTFHTKGGLSAHSKIHMALKPHACTLCPKSFITNQKLKEHMNGHMGIAPIQCTMCDRKFKRYSNLKQHKDIAHYSVKKKVKEYFCDCGETFISKKKLEWHKETHADKPKQCMYCSERYIHNASLTRHIRKAHNNEYIPPNNKTETKRKNVVCSICNLTFLDSSLRAHMKQHSSVKHFGCIVCGKKFHTKWNLSLHKWTHASRMSKPFKCTMCKGAFLRQSDLQAHIRAHYGNKPYTCNHCGMQFNRKHNWLRHEKEHLMEKKYTCQECGKSFHRNYYLADHARIHSGVKPYSCHICNKTSSTKSNHNKHVRTHHAREAVNTEA